MTTWIHQHLALSIALAWFFSNIVGTMPSPKDTGPTASWWYKWIFAAAHATIGALPRLIIQFFPQYAKLFGATPQQ